MKPRKLDLDEIKPGMSVILNWDNIKKTLSINPTLKNSVYKVADIKPCVIRGGGNCEEAKCPGKIQLEGMSERCFLYPSSKEKTPFYEYIILKILNEEDYTI